MKKTLLSLAFLVVVGFAGYYLVSQIPATSPPITQASDVKNATYEIEGTPVALVDGKAETEVTPGSESKLVTEYFGNEASGDLNADAQADIAFLLVQSGGGSGAFFYVAAGLKTENGYVGTNALFLGDRIAPQTTEIRDGQIIVNYADRKEGEGMATPPSVGVSKYFAIKDGRLFEIEKDPVFCTQDAKLCPNGSYVGRTGPNCEFAVCPGQSSSQGKSGIKGTVLLGPTCPVMRDPPDPQCADKPYGASFTVVPLNGTMIYLPFTSDASGMFQIFLTPGAYVIRPETPNKGLPYCRESESIVVSPGVYTWVTLHCDTGIR